MRVSRSALSFAVAAAAAVAVLPSPALAAAGTTKNPIEGQVSDIQTQLPVSGICVTAKSVGVSPQLTATTQTNGVGAYKLLVPDGTYKVGFSDCRPDPVYVPQWWDHVNTAAAATPIKVGGALTLAATGIDAALLPGVHVTGRVSDVLSGAALSGICVIAGQWGTGHGTAYTASTNSNGSYALFLPDGGYSIEFHDCRSTPEYLDQWWDHAASPQDAAELTVDSSVQSAQYGIDASLHEGGAITGHVTADATGQALANICVIDETAGVTATSDSTGAYTIRDLAPGTHLLMFDQCHGGPTGPTYAVEFFHHQATEQSADPVTVQAMSTTVVDETMRVGGTITGRITDAATGLPVSDVYVSASADDTAGAVTEISGANGTYTISGLYASNRYVLTFSDPKGRYSTQTLSGFVSVDFGTTTSGVDEALS